MIKEISVPEVAQKISRGDSFHLIDVREIEEWNFDHIPNATHLPRGLIERDIEEKFPNKDDEIVLYCERGVRSAYAAETLQHLGYKNVFSMAGGMSVWRRTS